MPMAVEAFRYGIDGMPNWYRTARWGQDRMARDMFNAHVSPNVGDYVLKDEQGEIHVCDANEFLDIYEVASDEKSTTEKEKSSRIIAVDFDGTLCENKWPQIGAPNVDLILYLLERKLQGSKLILWTCRTGAKLDKAVYWCAQCGLLFDAVNENLPETIRRFDGESRKIFAHEYIDDRMDAQFALPYVRED